MRTKREWAVVVALVSAVAACGKSRVEVGDGGTGTSSGAVSGTAAALPTAPPAYTAPRPAAVAPSPPATGTYVDSVAGPYVVESYTVPSGGFESLAHYKRLRFRDQVLADALDEAYPSPDGSAVVYCHHLTAASSFLHVAATGKKTPIATDACATSAQWNLERGTVVVKLPKRSVTLSFR
jgi:hypothetical protein